MASPWAQRPSQHRPQVRNYPSSEPLGCVPPLECAHEPPRAPSVCSVNKITCELSYIVELERKSAERVACERVESRRNEQDVGRPTLRRLVYRALKCVEVLCRWQSGWHRNIPHVLMRPAIRCGASPRIPGPLMHRDEADVRLGLHDGLCAVAVMNIPVHDEHALQAMTRSRITRGDSHRSKEAEAHTPGTERVMARRSHRREGALCATVEEHVHAVEHGASCRTRRIPGPLANDGVGIERSAARCTKRAYAFDIVRFVRQRELVRRCVARLVVQQLMKELGVVAQGSRNRA